VFQKQSSQPSRRAASYDNDPKIFLLHDGNIPSFLVLCNTVQRPLSEYAGEFRNWFFGPEVFSDEAENPGSHLVCGFHVPEFGSERIVRL